MKPRMMQALRSHRLLGLIAVLAFAATAALVTARAAAPGFAERYPIVRTFFPKATTFGPMEGAPPAVTAYDGKTVLGYVFETTMVAPVPAYSGEPMNILVGMDTSGRILGTKVLYQDEPILLVGIPVQRLYDFVARYIGHKATDRIVVGNSGGKGSIPIDAISSATVTSMAANETIMDSALKIAVSRKIVSPRALAQTASRATVRMSLFEPATWQELTGNGAIRRLALARGEVAEAFKGMPEPLFPGPTSTPPADQANAPFIDLYYALITPPTVGRNLLGKDEYDEVLKQMKPGDQAIALMANGIYSFKGMGYVRGGIFDRIHVVQGGSMMLFHDTDYTRLYGLRLPGMPEFREKAVFIIRHHLGFDPGAPWTLQLLVRREVGPLKSVYATFSGSYQTPTAYLKEPPASAIAANAPLWVQVWYGERFEIGVLVAGLAVLSAILIFQDWLVRRPRLLTPLRIGFLIYTAGFIGWYGLAQLSVVNILTFIHAALHEFRWSTFLMDPMIFILWTFVAVGVLMVGRGVYCGWLCPFGAIQELIGKAAKRLHVPQFEFPPFVHERLWALKYIILLGLFGLSLQSVDLAERYAEVEPFKTAIILHFARGWPFVLYAAALLLVSAFNSKFYCRYVCPLGAGLAIGGRYRLFEWLKRRRECGHPCQICAKECYVQAIDPLGTINMNECHYCLDCQVTYWNDHKCPPLVALRKRHERIGAAPKNPNVLVRRTVAPLPPTKPLHPTEAGESQATKLS